MYKYIVTPVWAAQKPGTKIYALLDPGRHGNRNSQYKRGDIRYIGRAVNPDKRLRVHWKVRGSNTPVYQWMRTLNAPPEMRILAVVDHEYGDGTDYAGYAENAYISWAWKKWGADQITNRSLNGHVIMVGKAYTPEHRAKLSARMKVISADPVVRARLSAISKAAMNDPVIRSRQSARSMALWAEDREKMMAYWDDEARASQAARAKIQFSSPEARANMSERGKAQFESKKARDMASERTKAHYEMVFADILEGKVYGFKAAFHEWLELVTGIELDLISVALAVKFRYTFQQYLRSQDPKAFMDELRKSLGIPLP